MRTIPETKTDQRFLADIAEFEASDGIGESTDTAFAYQPPFSDQSFESHACSPPSNAEFRRQFHTGRNLDRCKTVAVNKPHDISSYILDIGAANVSGHILSLL